MVFMTVAVYFPGTAPESGGKAIIVNPPESSVIADAAVPLFSRGTNRMIAPPTG